MATSTKSPILNYTTQIPVEKTVGEIVSLLAMKGATNVSMDYTDRVLSGVTFTFPFGTAGQVFKLPENAAGVAALMRKGKSTRKGPRQKADQYEENLIQQARKVAWRILKDWVEAQLALIDSAQATAVQAFLPYAVDKTGATYYEAFTEHHCLQLTSGDRHEP